MPKEYKITSAAALLEEFNDINKKYQNSRGDKDNKRIPYFVGIITRLKTITKIEDIAGIILKLEKFEEKVRINKITYPGDKVTPILNLFFKARSFLKEQQTNGVLAEDFNKIRDYDLTNIISTDEDDNFLSNSTPDLTKEKNELKIDNESYQQQIDSLNLANSKLQQELKRVIQEKDDIQAKLNETNQEKESLNKEKDEIQTKLNETNQEKNDIYSESFKVFEKLSILWQSRNNIDKDIEKLTSDFKKEKQAARKWWHWPLKFFTCGTWESSKIKVINKVYSDANSMLKIKIEELNLEYKKLIPNFESNTKSEKLILDEQTLPIFAINTTLNKNLAKQNNRRNSI